MSKIREQSIWLVSEYCHFVYFDVFLIYTFSNLSYIPCDQINAGVTMKQSTFQYCRCQCHHYVNNNLLRDEINNYSYLPKKYQQKRIKTKIYPFIF